MNQPTLQYQPYLDPSWSYQPNSRFYDEVLSADGQVRPHWRPLTDSLTAIGHGELARRWQEGQRFIYDNGITYNVYGDPQSTDRPWLLDPLPYLIEQNEWAFIEKAVIQRATLLNTMLSDLYGPQRLLRERLLPNELVFGNSAFLRPCSGISVPGNIHLHVYSADLARSPDGRWWVIADRTQAPSGAGYALENRLVSTRVLPDIFRSSHVHRLAGFFKTYRDTLLGLVQAQRENPRIVLLTPGPYNETYFEHAFLARYLGFTLVEGADLTVRNGRVFLKTLGGLLQVDVIVRRQDDSFCDPLELRPDSMLGVPGLLEAVRAGHVAVANALGSGLVESAAPSAFFPSLCRQLLGEELRMPTVATWWCGQKKPFDYVVNNMDRLVIKPAFPGLNQQPIFGAKLSTEERTALLDRMRDQPGDYVAQEQVSLSTVPVWDDGKVQPRHLVLRVYAVAAEGTYTVMPGGLTRVSSSLDSLVVSMQRGGGSKDTWVLADGPTSEFTLLRQSSQGIDVSRATFDLPSRVADNLFWLGRYTERVEWAVRSIRAMIPRLIQESDPSQSGLQTGMSLLAALGYLNPEVSRESGRIYSAERELLSLIYDSEERASLGSNINRIRRVAWLLRDRISTDAWRILNRLDQEFSEEAPPEPLQLAGAQDRLNHAVMTLSAFSGLVMESMTRGDGWRFLNIGRRMERALQITELLRQGLVVHRGGDPAILETLLEVADSSITYRSRYLTSVQADLVLDLLLIDEANPRSVAFQLVRMRSYVDQLPESQTLTRRPPEARLALALQTAAQLAEVEELVRPDSSGAWITLEQFLNRIQTDLKGLSDGLTRSYFIHAVPSRRLAG